MYVYISFNYCTPYYMWDRLRNAAHQNRANRRGLRDCLKTNFVGCGSPLAGDDPPNCPQAGSHVNNTLILTGQFLDKLSAVELIDLIEDATVREVDPLRLLPATE